MQLRFFTLETAPNPSLSHHQDQDPMYPMYQDSNCQRQAASVVALMPTLLLYDPMSLATISLGKASNLEGWILAISQLDLVFKSKG